VLLLLLYLPLSLVQLLVQAEPGCLEDAGCFWSFQ
jgi:hypothetical protein